MAEEEKHHEHEKEKHAQPAVEGGHAQEKEHARAHPEKHEHPSERKPLHRRLQPRLPRKVKFSKDMQDKRLLAGIAVVIVGLVLILMVMWLMPPSAPGPSNELSGSQVRAELSRLEGVNSQPLKINPADYPKDFGVYRGRSLQEIYYCSDVCPDYGRVTLAFQGVGPEDCASAGGKVVRDLAFGGYIGCEPRVI